MFLLKGRKRGAEFAEGRSPALKSDIEKNFLIARVLTFYSKTIFSPEKLVSLC